MRKNKILRNIWYGLSPNQRFLIRRLYYFPSDLLDKIRGRRHKYVPPRGYIYTGSPANAEKYIQQGMEQLEILKSEISLNRDDIVLDIGSGIGRTAIALTTYLSQNAKYEGFDVVERGVDWCNSKIKKDFDNFNFKYIPLFNDLYNKSELNAAEFSFPYEDNFFDKVFSFSVFTHMQIEEIEHYFEEISRVLKPDGYCLSTFFIYDENSEDYISSNNSFSFPIKKNGYRLMNENVKSGNIAIDLNRLNNMLSGKGLYQSKIIHGFWKDEVKDINKIEYQDIVIFKKAD